MLGYHPLQSSSRKSIFFVSVFCIKWLQKVNSARLFITSLSIITDSTNTSQSRPQYSSSSSIISQFILIIATHTADVLVSLSPFPHWVSFPWPITMTMGAGSMDTVTRQPAASAAAAAAGAAVSCQSCSGAAERAWANLPPRAACKFALWRGNVNAFIVSWIWSLLHYTQHCRCAPVI